MGRKPVLPRLPRQLDAWIALLGLLILAGSVLWRAPAYLGGFEPVGNDSSSHILASARVAELVRSGSDGWWMSDLNLGFPLAHFYQPLPHVTTALLALLLGGPDQAALAYKLLVVALLALAPFTTYFGIVRLGLGRAGALVGALALATLSAPQLYYGLTTRQYLLLGLYTMLFGAFVAPLALAEGVRFLQGRGRFSVATACFALLFLSHALLALGLVPVFVFAAFFAREGESPLRARLVRLVGLGAATGGVIGFWLLPQLVCSDYFGGWPISLGERADGFGLATVLRDWVHGRSTDFRRAPVIAIASLLGCAAASLRWRDATSRVVLFGVALFVVFTAGRVTFGRLVDWVFPPNARIEGMMRWIAMLHFFLAIAAGIAAQAVVDLFRRASTRMRAVALVVVTGVPFALTIPGRVADVAWGLDTFFESQDRESFQAVAGVLAEAAEQGRTYTAEPVGHQSHWVMAYLALVTGKPMTLSYGVGVQDSLNFFYLWSFGGDRPRVLVRDPKRAASAAELFNVRYVLANPGIDLSYLDATSLVRRGPYELLQLPGEYGYFDVVEAPDVVTDAPPAHLRARFERWMRAEYPRGARFLRLPDPIHEQMPGLPSATLSYREEQVEDEGADVVRRARSRPGEVLEEEAGTNRYRARIRVNGPEAWTVLKVTPHPWWHAEVDGKEQPIYYLSPAFQGLPLEIGEHEVVFVFRNPLWQKLLLVFSVILLAGLFGLDFRAARRRTG